MSVTITAADVKKLRDTTGAGMMDCKKALEEANGDFDGAIEYLRKKGQKMSEKRADRDAKEGVCLALTISDNTKAIALRISCETDFVSKNDDFVNFVQSIADLALANFPADAEALLKLSLNGQSVADTLVEKTGVIGEKVELAAYGKVEAPLVTSYIHTNNKAGVIVGFNKAVYNIWCS